MPREEESYEDSFEATDDDLIYALYLHLYPQKLIKNELFVIRLTKEIVY